MSLTHINPTDILERQAHQKFVMELIHSLESKPFEDGFYHPAQKIIEQTLEDFGSAAHNWIDQIFESASATRPWLAADLLSALGRLEPVVIDP